MAIVSKVTKSNRTSHKFYVQIDPAQLFSFIFPHFYTFSLNFHFHDTNNVIIGYVTCNDLLVTGIYALKSFKLLPYRNIIITLPITP